jgi:peptidoglycan/xylan/chitin deacetylase (PgdA/CDA1 family)
LRLHVRERLRRAPTWLRNKLLPGGLVLMYHRVADLPLDPFSLAVSPRHFEEHLEVLRKYSRPTHITKLAHTIRDGKRPRRMVAVTFDDGYTDNLYNAKPLLERYDIPASVFVTTGHIGNEREFMWDELERLLLEPGTLPRTLQLNINGTEREWDLGSAAHYSREDYLRDADWDTEQKIDPTPRHTLFRELHGLLKPLSKNEQQEYLNLLRAWAGAEDVARPTHRTMTADEVLHLAKGGLVEIGSHTVTHPVLSALSVNKQREEVQQSKAYLEEILDQPVKSFAYPFGGATDYTPETTSLLQEAGYDCACSNFPDIIWRLSDRYQLPRIDVRDWDGDEFAGFIRWLALG